MFSLSFPRSTDTQPEMASAIRKDYLVSDKLDGNGSAALFRRRCRVLEANAGGSVGTPGVHGRPTRDGSDRRRQPSRLPRKRIPSAGRLDLARTALSVGHARWACWSSEWLYRVARRETSAGWVLAPAHEEPVAAPESFEVAGHDALDELESDGIVGCGAKL